MICNRTKTGWEVVYQQAHAQLAAALIQHWQVAERPERWFATLDATAQHDNGWQEWEPGDRLTPAGTPRDFTETPVRDMVLQSERAVTRARHKSLWAGLLVSRHIDHLYRRLRRRHDEIDALLKRQTALRSEWRRRLGIKKDQVSRAYALLRWGDTFSLILCQRKVPPDGRSLEIGAGPDGTRYFVTQTGEEVLRVEPWPYEVERFSVEVDTYTLNKLTFASDDELAEALHAAPMQPRTWMLEKG